MYVEYQSGHRLSFRLSVGRTVSRLGEQTRQYIQPCSNVPKSRENRRTRTVRFSIVSDTVENVCQVCVGVFLNDNISIFIPQYNLPSQTAVAMDAMCLMTWKEK